MIISEPLESLKEGASPINREGRRLKIEFGHMASGLVNHA